MDAVLLSAAIAVLAIGALVWRLLDPSWARQVRWTVAASALGFAGLPHAVSGSLDLRDVVLGAVEVRDGVLHVHALDRRAGFAPLTYAAASLPAPEVLAMFEEWHELRTPLVLYIERSGVASLTGPVATIADLRPVATRGVPARPVMQEETEGP
ncbi:MAG TPA: hypothetical protein VH986_07815 [Acidimicrobiia bacterium]|jgi:hypothetical protein